jgi:hypothetical protein
MEQTRQLQQREQQADQERERSLSNSSAFGSGTFKNTPPPVSDNSEAARREVAEARRMWEKQPPLAPNRNPLLGKWVLQRSNSPTQNTLLGVIAQAGALSCGILFGEGVIEYRETVLADGAGNALDQVQYRGANNRVAVLGTRGVQLAVFDFEGPNRIKPAGFDCTLVRAGPPAMASLRDASPQAGAPAAAPRPAVGGGIAGLGVKFGFTLEAVRQNLAARRVSLMPARHNGDNYSLVAGGDFTDIDQRIKRVAYQFDAPESPAAKLVGVVIMYARDNGGAQSAVFSERAATMSKQYPLAPQSPTKLEASVPGAIVSLIDDPTFSQVYEIYRVR